MLQAGQRFGDFEIIRLLGKGGMGEVYEARQFNPDRPIALKILAPWLSNDEDALARFWREAKVPANLDHPGIVRIISTGKTSDGIAYYAMLLVRGMSLAEMIRQAKDTVAPPTGATPHTAAKPASEETRDEVRPLQPGNEATSGATDVSPVTSGTAITQTHVPRSTLPSEDRTTPVLQEYVQDRYTTVALIGAQAARALAYAHGQGYLHRDIKPANLMVDQHRHVYLVDFGLTRALNPDGHGTHPGALPGTPWYMSPEQANGLELDPRSDIYSLGVTLYELATKGKGPFTASRQDKHQVLTQVRSGTSIPLRTLAPDIPKALEKIILKAMSPRPQDRYADATELAYDLETLKAPSSSPTTRIYDAAEPKPLRRWPKFLVGAVAAALVIAATAVIIVPWLRGERFEGRNAMPESLRRPSPRTAIALLKDNWEPEWSQPICGTGGHRPTNAQLEIYSPPEDKVTMIALADPDRAAFEFAIDVNWLKSFKKDTSPNEIGVFFGLRRQPPDPDGHHCYFILKLDETPVGNDVNGQLIVGTGRIIEKREGRLESGKWFAPLELPDGRAVIALPSKSWHKLKVQVRPDGFTIHIGSTVKRDFPMTQIREVDRNGVPATDGAVGIWASRGRGFFRNATISVN